MNDRVVGLLDQYEIEVLRTRKGRGAIICDTDRGCLIFKEYSGNPEKIKLQDRVLKKLCETGVVPVERIIPNKEEGLLTEDSDGKKYVLKSCCEGRECNSRDLEECREAVRALASLHKAMCLTEEETEQFGLSPFSLEREQEKHNRELRRVRRYLREKGQKSVFESALLREYDYFLAQASEVANDWKAFASDSDLAYIKEQGMLCHGDYQYHNILHYGQGFAVVNFEHCMMDNPIRDLSLFMRKLLEKNGWSRKWGEDLLKVYCDGRPLSAHSYVELYYRLAYPEKFWKIVNFYYNSRKVWIPERNREKLQLVVEQEKEKQAFLDAVFRTIA